VPEPEPPAVSAVRGIVASFKESKTNLLAPPPELLPRRRLRACNGCAFEAATLSVAPKDVNPATWCLDFSHHRWQVQWFRNSCAPDGTARCNRGQARKKAGLPAWTVSFLVALTLFLGVGSLLQYLAANRDAKAAGPTATPSEQSSSPVSTSEQPASKLVEVTGLRVASGPNINRNSHSSWSIIPGTSSPAWASKSP